MLLRLDAHGGRTLLSAFALRRADNNTSGVHLLRLVRASTPLGLFCQHSMPGARCMVCTGVNQPVATAWFLPRACVPSWRISRLMRSHLRPSGALVVRSRLQPGRIPYLAAVGAIRGGGYTSAIVGRIRASAPPSDTGSITALRPVATALILRFLLGLPSSCCCGGCCCCCCCCYADAA